MDDVVIAGAGPAGAFAAYLLASQGARVTLVDRARFPREKLCGDTLNPGALALLRHHFDLSALTPRGCPIDGMLLTGPGGVSVRGEYRRGGGGLGITRIVLDSWLLDRAIAAGARLVEDTTVLGPDADGRGAVRGVVARHRSGRTRTYAARITLGADGRRSRLGEACGLSSCATRPRRWAIGAYFEQVDGLDSVGEMHVRRGHYLGVAPTPDGRANACLVQPYAPAEGHWSRPEAVLLASLQSDPLLAARFRRARPVSRTVVLGPLAIDTPHPGRAGLLLIGDAGGFVDPMTGDGIHLALQSADVAAAAVGGVLEGRLEADTAHVRFARDLRPRVRRKRVFNRALRGLVGSPGALRVAASAARAWPAAFQSVIRYAGDAGLP